MDHEAAMQRSRQGYADATANLRELLAELDPASRADIDRCAAAIVETLQANGVTVTAEVAKVFQMAVAMVGVEIMKHHGNTYPVDRLPCLEDHHLRCELAAAAVLQQQEGADG